MKMNNSNTTLPSAPYMNYYSSTIKTRFAMKFLQAMKRLQQKKGGDRYRRYRAVRDAARTSMASAVGPGRAWSRAVLRKRRNYVELRSRRNPSTSTSSKEEEELLEEEEEEEELLEEEEEEELRGVVPGGEEMGFCRLLSETAHYIICLQAQVQVMTDILHASSSSSSSS